MNFLLNNLAPVLALLAALGLLHYIATHLTVTRGVPPYDPWEEYELDERLDRIEWYEMQGWSRDDAERIVDELDRAAGDGYCPCGAHVLGTPCYSPPDDAA